MSFKIRVHICIKVLIYKEGECNFRSFCCPPPPLFLSACNFWRGMRINCMRWLFSKVLIFSQTFLWSFSNFILIQIFIPKEKLSLRTLPSVDADMLFLWWMAKYILPEIQKRMVKTLIQQPHIQSTKENEKKNALLHYKPRGNKKPRVLTKWKKRQIQWPF